jgi:hypothetical protein
MKSIFLIQDWKSRSPIITASTLEIAERMLNEYMGVGIDPSVKYHGFDMLEYPVGHVAPYLGNYCYTHSSGESVFLLYSLPVDEHTR